MATHRCDKGKVGIVLLVVHHSRDGSCRSHLLRRDAYDIFNHLGGTGVRFSIMDKGRQGGIRILENEEDAL